MKFLREQNRLLCFSPPVMLATMLIEFGGAAYTIWRYKLNSVGRLVVLVLIFLGIFQLAEFLICQVTGLPGLTWARIGYVAITMLPPLGVSLAMAIAGKKSWPVQFAMYATAAAFIIYFGFASQSLTGQVCEGNYVIFTSRPGAMFWYAAYYYGLLAISTGLCFYWTKLTKSVRKRRALLALAIGYMAFITPTIAVGLISPAARDAIPSIMCGFAVLLAVVLLVVVLPNAGILRKSK